ncbi:MAG: GntR family transcriptional regulator [Lachnospiraceae bacterium]|nr:GntR family transcriptional regulator [Lachnospiraceae bacterium]
MATLKLIENDYLPLRDVVYQTLRNAILVGDLKPGERLMEMKLASKLGVSRTPVREAIQLLEKEGLAITMPRRGARVAKMTQKDMADVYEIRRCLEKLVVETVNGKLDVGQIADIRYAQRVFEEAVAEGDPAQVERKDWEFHCVIFEATGNDHLVSIMNTLQEQLSRYRWAYVQHSNKLQKLVEEHRNIVNALEKGVLEESIAATMAHLESQEEIITTVIQKGD